MKSDMNMFPSLNSGENNRIWHDVDFVMDHADLIYHILGVVHVYDDICTIM